MYRGRTVGVVVPAYNEGGFVTDVLSAMPDFVDRCYAIDDGSTDGTWVELRAFAGEYHWLADDEDPASLPLSPVTERAGDDPASADGGRVVAVRHESNQGAGGAIKTGYRLALEDGLDVTVTIDADGQMDPGQMHRVVAPVASGRADYAKGNRLTSASGRGEMPRFRWVGNWLLTGLTKVASGYWRVRDPQNGYTAISRRALEAIDVPSLYEYYGYSNDVLVRLNAAELRVADVAMPAAYGDEESSIRYSGYVPKVSLLLLWRFLWRLRVRYLSGRFHPLVACYGVGLLGAGYGLALGVGTVVTDGWRGPVVPDLGATLLFVLAGVLLTAVGMAFDRQENRGLEVRLE